MAPRISQKVAVGAVFVAAMFMTILDATIVNVALPTIGRDFGVSATAVDGISIAFLVSLAVTIPYFQDGRGLSALGSAAAHGHPGTVHSPGVRPGPGGLLRHHQPGGAIGVAVLTSVIVLSDPVHVVDGHEVANLTAYRIAFLTAAAISLCAMAFSLSIRDADAAGTIPGRRGREEGEPRPAPASAA